MRAARAVLALGGLAGVVALVLATFLPVIEIAVAQDADITADLDRSLSGYDRHSLALVLIALVAAAMHAGALARGSRPAMLAVAVLGAAALGIAVVADAPDLDQTGPVGELYAEASASAGPGFYAETLGGALLLIAGGGMLVLGAPSTATAATRPARRPRRTSVTRANPEPEGDEAEPVAAAPPRVEPAFSRREPVAPPAPKAPDVPDPSPAAEAGATRDVPEPAPPAETEATPEDTDRPDDADAGRLSFEERLREARERAARRRGS